MASLASENLNRAMNALITLDQEDIDEVYKVEENINFLNHAITDYLVKINQSTLPIEDLKSIGALFHVVNDIERIGDHAENVAEAAVERKEKNIQFSQEAQRELADMMDKVIRIMTYSMDMFSHNSRAHLQEILELEDNIDRLDRHYRDLLRHARRSRRPLPGGKSGFRSRPEGPGGQVRHG